MGFAHVVLENQNATYPIYPNRMKEMIEADFSVDLISEQGSRELFGALRKGGTEAMRTQGDKWVTHGMGVWHLILNHPVQKANFTRNHITQWHIPRYDMACHLDNLIRASELHPNAARPILSQLAEELSLALLANNQLGFAFDSEGLGGELKKTFQTKLKKEDRFLKMAREQVMKVGDEFVLLEVRTPAGHQVKSQSRKLVESIAFERAVLGDLDPSNFGIYSAYCTQVDSDTTREMPEDFIRSLVDSQREHGDALWDIAGQTDSFFHVQELLFRKPIWGPGLNLKENEAVTILAEGMGRLERSQRVQFVLMNGMHAAGLLLPLCVISNLISFEEYVSIMCRYFQPDSPEEQDHRKETAYLKLFGELSKS